MITTMTSIESCKHDSHREKEREKTRNIDEQQKNNNGRNDAIFENCSLPI